MQVGGNYTQTGAGWLRLEILGDNGVCDQLVISGIATLSGTLDIALGAGYQPGGPNPRTWTPIFYFQGNGQFTTVNRPPNFAMPFYNPNVAMTITWTP